MDHKSKLLFDLLIDYEVSRVGVKLKSVNIFTVVEFNILTAMEMRKILELMVVPRRDLKNSKIPHSI